MMALRRPVLADVWFVRRIPVPHPWELPPFPPFRCSIGLDLPAIASGYSRLPDERYLVGVLPIPTSTGRGGLVVPANAQEPSLLRTGLGQHRYSRHRTVSHARRAVSREFGEPDRRTIRCVGRRAPLIHSCRAAARCEKRGVPDLRVLVLPADRPELEGGWRRDPPEARRPSAISEQATDSHLHS
jgi:hypothetical protein